MGYKPINGEQFRKEYKNIKPGAYLFYGDENFLKHRELESLRNRICADESLAQFNHFVFTRDNYSVEALLAAIETMPVMSDMKLVELYELPFAEYRKKADTEGLEAALKAASESEDTVFVIYTTEENFTPGEPKSPSALMKLFCEYALPVEFPSETTQRLTMWVGKHFAAEKIIAEVPECVYLIETVGHDMTTLCGEISKLVAYLTFKERDRLQKLDIDLVCPKNKEIGAFEFADAILDANSEKAFYILDDMKKRSEPVSVILGGIIKIYSDLYSLKLCTEAGMGHEEAAKRLGINPYVAKIRMAKAKSCEKAALEEIIFLCAKTDEDLKSLPLDEYLLLERLIVQSFNYRKRKVF